MYYHLSLLLLNEAVSKAKEVAADLEDSIN